MCSGIQQDVCCAVISNFYFLGFTASYCFDAGQSLCPGICRSNQVYSMVVLCQQKGAGQAMSRQHSIRKLGTEQVQAIIGLLCMVFSTASPELALSSIIDGRKPVV